MTLADSCQLLHARWSNVTSSRSAAWIGSRSTLTDHVWTTTELLSYRVPPQFLDKLPELERLYPPFEEIYHGS